MLAIIPARGGSKGLPGKNIKLLKGSPLISYTINAAKSATLVDEIIVSTESEKIAEIATKYGAQVPFLRPEELATDDAKVIDTYLFTIEKLNLDRKDKINEFIVLQPTSPLRTPMDIDNAIELFYKKNADSVISYTEEEHPIFWHKKINKDLTFTNIFEDTIENRQNYVKTFYPNGAIFVFKYSLIKEGKYYSNNSYAFIMPRSRSVDIDTIDDFKYAEFLLNYEENN